MIELTGPHVTHVGKIIHDQQLVDREMRIESSPLGFSHMNHTDESVAELLTLTREVDDWGTIRYRNSAGQLHRIHGPAMTLPDGSEIWFQTSRLHREGGPADTWPDGTEYWYLDGMRHRVGGPAVIYQDGDCQWWLNGQQLTEYEWRDQVAEIGTTF